MSKTGGNGLKSKGSEFEIRRQFLLLHKKHFSLIMLRKVAILIDNRSTVYYNLDRREGRYGTEYG